LQEHAATSKQAPSGAAQGALELSLLMNSTEAAAMSLRVLARNGAIGCRQAS